MSLAAMGARTSCHAVDAIGPSPRGAGACRRCCRMLHARRQGCCPCSAANSARTRSRTSGGNSRAGGLLTSGCVATFGLTEPSTGEVCRTDCCERRRGAGRSAIAFTQRPLFSQARTLTTASAPASLQIMPACFSRALTRCLQVLSIVPLPICSPRAR